MFSDHIYLEINKKISEKLQNFEYSATHFQAHMSKKQSQKKIKKYFEHNSLHTLKCQWDIMEISYHVPIYHLLIIHLLIKCLYEPLAKGLTARVFSDLEWLSAC